MWLFLVGIECLKLPYQVGDKEFAVILSPGLNKIDKIRFSWIKQRNAARWLQISKILMVYSENDTDPNLEQGSGSGFYLKDSEFAQKTILEASEDISCMNNVEILKNWAGEEANLGKNRPGIERMIRFKINSLPETEAKFRQEHDSMSQIYRDMGLGGTYVQNQNGRMVKEEVRNDDNHI